jgi:hypothetical protein
MNTSTGLLFQGSQPIIAMQLKEKNGDPIDITSITNIFAHVSQGDREIAKFSYLESEGYDPDCISITNAAYGMFTLTLFPEITRQCKAGPLTLEIKAMNESEPVYETKGVIAKVEKFFLKDAE